MVEIPGLELGWFDALLRPHQLQLVSRPLYDLGPRLRTDADPVDSRRRGQRPVGLDRNPEAARVNASIKRGVELEHRLSAGDHDEPVVHALAPQIFT